VSRQVQLVIKRAFDVLLALVVLTLGLPLLAGIALCVKLSSPGPVLFIQERVGRGGKPFRMFKFRSMRVARAAQQEGLWSVEQAQRITPTGRFLRDYGLDELPQAYNILRGEMSFIGPRAPLPARAKAYTARERISFGMRPGLISLAVHEGRRSLSMQQRVELHVQYVERWSLCLDASILLRSIPVVLLRRNADENGGQAG